MAPCGPYHAVQIQPRCAQAARMLAQRRGMRDPLGDRFGHCTIKSLLPYKLQTCRLRAQPTDVPVQTPVPTGAANVKMTAMLRATAWSSSPSTSWRSARTATPRVPVTTTCMAQKGFGPAKVSICGGFQHAAGCSNPSIKGWASLKLPRRDGALEFRRVLGARVLRLQKEGQRNLEAEEPAAARDAASTYLSCRWERRFGMQLFAWRMRECSNNVYFLQ